MKSFEGLGLGSAASFWGQASCLLSLIPPNPAFHPPPPLPPFPFNPWVCSGNYSVKGQSSLSLPDPPTNLILSPVHSHAGRNNLLGLSLLPYFQEHPSLTVFCEVADSLLTKVTKLLNPVVSSQIPFFLTFRHLVLFWLCLCAWVCSSVDGVRVAVWVNVVEALEQAWHMVLTQ